jgi:hypothetical protein
MVFWLAVVAFFGLVVGAAGEVASANLPVYDDSDFVRLPFDETVKCLNSSAVEALWLYSENDLQVELVVELEEYLYQSLPNNFLYLENVNVTLRKYEHANETEAARSVFRQSDYMAGYCNLDLKLVGNGMFQVGSMDQTLSSKVPGDQPAIQRSAIFSQVSKALAEQYNGIIVTDTALYWSTIDTAPTLPQTPSSTPSPATPLPTPSPTPTVSSSIACLMPVEGVVSLFEGDFFCSPNGKFKFGLATDGDLALVDVDDNKIWSANTCCTGKKVMARLQIDGNLVVSSLVTRGKKLWASNSGTKDLSVMSLIVGDDGIVTITDTLRGHIWSNVIENRDRVKANSLVGKVMAGYQGWFHADGDGGMNRWIHWSRHPTRKPAADIVTIDTWPDLREFDDDELYQTDFSYDDGSNAALYSAYNAKTVERHIRWMKEYDLHGVFAQRFIGNTRDNPLRTRVIDTVLGHIRSGAEKYGRTFVNMWDISNGNEETVVEDIINDWKHLVDDEHITKSKQYLHHRGRPLVAIWGFGFFSRIATPQQAAQVIDWFHNTAEDKYKATVMGGVPKGWRDLVLESKIDPEWASVYRSFDVISPWTVGRMRSISSANIHRRDYIEPDLAECESLGIDYLPVVFPGFSFANLKPGKPFNEIPRNGGNFMWHQMHNAVAAGSKMLYVAMFDETDEGTAIFKIAENQQQTPIEGQFIAADQDGYSCPGDWYLNITGTVARLVQDGKVVPPDMPAYP